MMEEANVDAIVRAKKDHGFRVLKPRLDATEQILEEIIPIEVP